MSSRSTPPRDTPADRRLVQAALLLSALSAALSAYAAFGRAPPAPTGDAAALRAELTEAREALDAKADAAQLAGALQRLHARIDALEARSRLPGSPDTGAGADADADGSPTAPAASAAPAAPSAAEPPRTAPRFVQLSSPEKGVSVKQMDDGSIAVTNSDPALTGRTLLIKARADDGTERDLTITVPAP